MRVNGSHELLSYNDLGQRLTLALAGTGMAEAVALGSGAIEITDGETLVARYEGYSMTSVEDQGDCVVARLAVSVPENVRGAMDTLTANVAAVRAIATEAAGRSEAMESETAPEILARLDELSLALMEVAEMVAASEGAAAGGEG